MNSVAKFHSLELLDLEVAFERAGFYISRTLYGTITICCLECQRDSGLHWTTCSKANRPREDKPEYNSLTWSKKSEHNSATCANCTGWAADPRDDLGFVEFPTGDAALKESKP